nr:MULTISPECIES: c-type cytochrome [unclassified Campylobacter]
MKEYAKMLYENPRGIGCKNCHGERGEGKILAYYTNKGIKTPYLIPSIQGLNFEDFKKSLMQIKSVKSIMPNYSLTDNEIIALYNYINQDKEQKNEK